MRMRAKGTACWKSQRKPPGHNLRSASGQGCRLWALPSQSSESASGESGMERSRRESKGAADVDMNYVETKGVVVVAKVIT